MLVVVKEIVGVYFICYIFKFFCYLVRDNDVGLLFEGGEIMFQVRVEEWVFFYYWFVDDYFNIFCFDMFYNFLNRRCMEVIWIVFYN